MEPELLDNKEDAEKPIEKSIALEIHIDFKKKVEKKYDWNLDPNKAFKTEGKEKYFTYEQIVNDLEFNSIKEFENQLRAYLNNNSIQVRHSKTNVGSISLILTVIDWLDNANKIVDFLENIGKVKKFAQKFFKSDVTNKYGDYFNVSSTVINDPNQLSGKDLINHFLWFCAGAKLKYIKHCPTDHIKFANIGLTVFITSLLAFFTSTYACYTITNNSLISLAVGLFWAFIIFSLDRTIVSSIKSGDKLKLLKVVPRFFLAITLALLISNPFELLVFKKRVDKELISMAKQNEIQFIQEKMDNNEIKELKNKILSNETEIQNRNNLITILEDSLDAEVKGFSKTKLKGYGVSARNIFARIDRVKNEIADFKSKNKNPTDKLDLETSIIKNEALKFSTKNKGVEDLIERNQALSIIIAKEPFARYTYYLLFFALLLFELSPIIIKLTSTQGTYEAFMETLEKQGSKEHLEEIRNIDNLKLDERNNLLIRINHKFDILQNELKHTHVDNLPNTDLLNYLKKEQLEVSKVIIDKFKNLYF